MGIEIGFILLMLCGGLVGSRLERRDWNGGKCRRHGKAWEYFSTDSQGGRGYSCRTRPGIASCTTWQSYGHDCGHFQPTPEKPSGAETGKEDK